MTQERRRGLSILPTTRVGRWSLVLALLSIAGLATVLVAMELGITEDPGRIGELLLVLAHPITSALAGVASLVAGLVAVVRHHERSVTTLAVLGWGSLVAVVIAGEALLPH